MTPAHESIIAELKRRAEVQVNMAKQISGVDLDYSEASVAKLDAIIEDSWGGQVPGQLDAMVEIFGAYLGEVFVRQLNGHWAEQEGNWVVDFSLPDGSIAHTNVFSKVRKRFMNGPEDSLGYYFHAVQKMQKEGFYSSDSAAPQTDR